MARKNNERYVRYYTFGSTAAKLDQTQRKAALPEYKNAPKRKPIVFDPVSALGNAVAILLAILMIVGICQVAGTAAQVHELQTQVEALELEQQLLLEKYESGYDLDEIRVAAESMGMVPAEEAIHVSLKVPAETLEIQQLSWWDNVLASLRQFFA